MPEQQMSDQEVVCSFMEKRPECPDRCLWFESASDDTAWWRKVGGTNRTLPRDLDLDALHDLC